MIRRHVLAALAAGIEAGDDDAARRALARTDYVLRGLARRRLERALIDAALACEATDARHVQQLAALTVAGVAVEDARDATRVAAAYASLAPAPRPRLPIATIVAGVLATAVVGVVSLYAWTRPGAPSKAYARPLPPPVAGAFKDGGVPLPDEAIATLFVEELTSLVIETDRDRQRGGLDPDRKAHSIALIGAPAIAKHGPALVKAWAEMLDMLDRWTSVPQSSEEFRDIVRAFRHRVRAVSDQLAAAGIGYYLEGDVLTQASGAHALIYSYRVEEVVFVTAGGQPRRVLSLRRLDRLNLTHTLLGMQSGELGDPVLLLDQIDKHVATHVLPVLAVDAAYPLADDEYGRGPGAAIATAVGAAVRAELARVLGKDAAAAHEIAGLLAERATIIDGWREIMERKGWRLARTDELFLPEGMIAGLDGSVSNAERRRAAEIETRLAELEAPRIAARCHELVAATVRRHEAQHGLDEDRAEPLRYPRALSQHLGEDTTDEDGEPLRYIESARLELTAYLSQLANDPTTPQLTLWNVARWAYDATTWGTSESYAGVILVEGLARHLGIASPGPVIHDRTIDRDRLTQLALPLTAVEGERMRTAAVALWTELYGEPLAPIVDR